MAKKHFDVVAVFESRKQWLNKLSLPINIIKPNSKNIDKKPRFP